MKRIIIYLSVLFMSFIPLAVAAQGTTGGDIPDENGLFLKKNIAEFSYDTMRGKLNLECFVTGEMTAEIAPVDVVLVLDNSDSMIQGPEKLEGLKSGCSVFLDKMYEIVADGGDARIGIVSFNSTSKIRQEMTALTLETIDGMKEKINDIGTASGTDMYLGLNNAYKLLNTEYSAERKKMVVFFTDGEPYRGETPVINVANDAVKSAYNLKKISAEIFTVGLFAEDPSTNILGYKLSVFELLEHLSSYYPRVQSIKTNSVVGHYWLDENGKQNSFRDYSGTEYYAWAQTPDDLANIFTNIGSVIVSKADLPLQSKAVVKDVMSPECNIPEGTIEDDIKVYSAACTGGDAEEGFTFGERDIEPYLNIFISGKSVNVTGFDYGENWVGWNASTGQYQGRKLIIEIPFEVNASALVDKDVNKLNTNDKSSGVYLDNTQLKPFEEFEVPEIEFINIQISDTGLLERESAIFVLERKMPDETSFSMIAKVALTANEETPGEKVSKMVMYLDSKAEYRVARLGSWSWAYTNTPDPTVSHLDNLIVFDFSNEKRDGISMQYKERVKDNDFKGDGTLMPGVDVNPWNQSSRKRISF